MKPRATTATDNRVGGHFWTSPVVNSLPWRVIYDGPVPKRVNLVAPMSGDGQYVYMLFDDSVSRAILIKIQEPPRLERPSWRPAPNTAKFEAHAIAALNPRANIAPPSKQAMR